MKNLAFLLLLFLSVLACSNDNPVSNGPVPVPTPTTQLFDLTKVPEIELQFSLAQWNALLTNYDLNPKNEKKVISRFTYKLDGQTTILDSIGLKLRGNTSRRRPEGVTGQLHNQTSPNWNHCHFSIDFDKNRPGQKFNGISKLNLKWFKDDASYVREVYSYDLFRRFGIWTAPRASYCRVSIKVDGDALPANFGVYAMIESVDEDFISTRGANWGPSAGYLWKGSHIGSHKADFVSTESIGIEDVKMNPANSQYFAYDLKTKKDDLAAASIQLTTFITDLNTKSGAEFKSWISQKMDIDLFLKTYATSIMLGMWDDHWVNGNNFYFHFASNGKAYFIPYDYDNTLGTSSLMPNSGTQDPLNWGPAARPLVKKVLEIPEYRDKFKGYINELANANNDLFSASKSMQRIAAWQTMVGPYVSNATGEDMSIIDQPASWGNAPFYRLSSGNSSGGSNGNANFFSSRIQSIPW